MTFKSCEVKHFRDCFSMRVSALIFDVPMRTFAIFLAIPCFFFRCRIFLEKATADDLARPWQGRGVLRRRRCAHRYVPGSLQGPGRRRGPHILTISCRYRACSQRTLCDLRDNRGQSAEFTLYSLYKCFINKICSEKYSYMIVARHPGITAENGTYNGPYPTVIVKFILI